MRDDDGKDAGFADPASDQLRVLSAEINDDDRVEAGEIGRRRDWHTSSYVAAVPDPWTAQARLADGLGGRLVLVTTRIREARKTPTLRLAALDPNEIDGPAAIRQPALLVRLAASTIRSRFRHTAAIDSPTPALETFESP